MKDGELRGLVLQRFYDLRHNGPPVNLEQLKDISPSEFVRLANICEQLEEHGLIKWNVVKALTGTIHGHGSITAHGVDVIDGDVEPTLSITLHHHNVSVSGSQNVQIGNSNVLHANASIGMIDSAIDQSNGSAEEKAEAKTLWSKVFNNATFAAVIGALTAIGGSSAH